MKNNLRVYSGTCCMCDVGIETNQEDIHGAPLYTGDIVQLWHGNYIGTEYEEWMPSSGLTVITADQYQSYGDGTIDLLTNEPIPFTMGIRSVGVQGEEWRVSIVKSHSDLVDGERFASFGINFKADRIEQEADNNA